jgi:hypothetical protein
MLQHGTLLPSLQRRESRSNPKNTNSKRVGCCIVREDKLPVLETLVDGARKAHSSAVIPL